MKHPHPLASPKRDVDNEEIIGWFMVAFDYDPDHEYSFSVHKNGNIDPEIDTLDIADRLKLFYKYIAEPDFHHVRFIKRTNHGY